MSASIAPGGLPLVVSLDDPEPMYRQIEGQLRRLILKGHLAPGTTLPSVRSLASDLACSVITTRRAYQELESQGFIRTRQGMGTIVIELSDETTDAFKREPVEHAFRVAIREGFDVGMSERELREVFENVVAGVSSHEEVADD